MTLANLPGDLDLKDIFGIVWGGRVENLKYKEGETTCTVLFLQPQSCKAYCRAAAAGIPWPKDSKRLITIQSVEEKPLNEFEAGLVQTHLTRCVRITNIPSDVTPEALKEVAKGKDRVVERMVNGKFGSVSRIRDSSGIVV